MIFKTIAEVIADLTECESSSIKPETTFAELGIDSLDTVEIIMKIEEKLDVEIDLEEKVESVADLCEFINKKTGLE